MVLDTIHRYKEQFKEFIRDDLIVPNNAPHPKYNTSHSSLHEITEKLQSLNTFKENWNLDSEDFKSMYARSFANTLANDLWEGQSFFPKKAMLSFIDRDPDLVRAMFKELFNENLDVEGRIDRFVYHCDQLSDDMMRSNPEYQSHYHDGYRMISVYLAFRYPMQYTIYKFDHYRAFMILVKARMEPNKTDIGRFFKVMRTVYSILAKDEELLSAYRNLSAGRNDLYQDEALMLVCDYYWFCSTRMSML